MLRINFLLLAVVVLLPLPALAAQAKDCTPFIDMRIRRVDTQQLRDAWLSWLNAERAAKGLQPLIYNPQLNRTAVLWSKNAAEQGSISHKRTANAAYYDYAAIENWFRDKGVQFTNINRITFSESIGWGPYACKSGNCTKDLTDAMRSTYDFYIGEKTKKDRPHYNAMTRPEYTQVGLGIAIMNGRYYLTTHYGTEFLNEPVPLCRARVKLDL